MLGRKSLIVSASLLTANFSFAGFYIGASGGPEGARFNQRAHVQRFATFDVIDQNHFAGIGGFGSIFAGYSRTFNQWYLGGEVNGNASSTRYQLKNIEYIHQNLSKTTFRVKHSWGVSLLPGYFLSENNLFYGRIGYSNAQIKIQESDPTIPNAKKNRDGLRYGFGLRHYFTPQVSFIMDYSQVNYSGIRGSVYESFGAVIKNTKITTDTAQVGLGLIYDFDCPMPVGVYK